MLRIVIELLVVGILAVGALAAAGGILTAPAGPAFRHRRGLGLMGATIAAAEVRARGTRIGWACDVLANALLALSDLTRWPCDLIAFIRFRRRVRRLPLRVAEIKEVLGWSPVLWRSVASLAFVFVVTLSVALVGVHPYLIVGAEAAIVANVGQQLATTLRPATLVEGLRNGLPPPVVQLAVIALVDFLCLVLAAVILLHWGHASSFDWGWLPAEARHVLAFQHVSALWRVHSMGTREVLVGLGGLAFYTVLLSQLLRVKQLRRTPADRARIAQLLVHAGELDAAERWLAPTGPGRQLCPEDHQALGLHALARGKYPHALAHARSLAGLQGVELRPVNANDNALYLLLAWAKLWVEPWSKASLASRYPMTHEEERLCTSVVRFALEQGISDAALVGALPRPYGTRRQPNLDLFWTQDLGIVDPPWPLTVAKLEIMTGACKQALVHLESAKVVGLEAELVTYLLRMDTNWWDTYPRELGSLEDRFDRAWIQIARTFVDDAKAWDIDEIPLWLRDMLSHSTFGLEASARRMGSLDVVSALHDLRSSLVGEVEGRAAYTLWRVGTQPSPEPF